MGHDVWETINDYWSTSELHCTRGCQKVVRCNCFMHVLQVSHFQNNQNLPDKANLGYNRLWKI